MRTTFLPKSLKFSSLQEQSRSSLVLLIRICSVAAAVVVASCATSGAAPSLIQQQALRHQDAWMNGHRSLVQDSTQDASITLPGQNAMLPNVYDRYEVQLLEPPAGTISFEAWLSTSGLLAVNYWPWDGATFSAIVEKGSWNFLRPQFKAFGLPTPSGTLYGSWVDNGERGVLYRRGEYTLLPSLPTHPDYNFAVLSMNARGFMLVAYYHPNWWVDPDIHCALVTPSLSIVEEIAPPEAVESWPHALNNRNWAVGRYSRSDGGYSGFLLDDGGYHIISGPGGAHLELWGINTSGDMVGQSWTSQWDKGIVIEKGEMFAFTIPGVSWTSIDSINDKGQLCGTYGITENGQFQRKIFIATRRGRH